MSEEEIIKYAKIFSNAKGDTYKINFVNENKTIDEVEIWKEILKLIDKKDKEIDKLMNIKLYACDTEKNKECNKKYCIENGGECDATTNKAMAKYVNLDDYVSKEKIRKFIKEELPDDEIMECCEMYDSNGIYLRKKLEEILEE